MSYLDPITSNTEVGLISSANVMILTLQDQALLLFIQHSNSRTSVASRGPGTHEVGSSNGGQGPKAYIKT